MKSHAVRWSLHVKYIIIIYMCMYECFCVCKSACKSGCPYLSSCELDFKLNACFSH